MKDVFELAQLVISPTISTTTSSTDAANNIAVATTTPTPFLTIKGKTERRLTYEERMFFNMIIFLVYSPKSNELEIYI